MIRKIMARKWQKLVCCTRFGGDGGHIVIYSTDQRRFVLPLEYLRHNIFQELLKISEQEFGLPSDGPITLPCDSVFMGSLVSLIQRGNGLENWKKALLISVNISSFLYNMSAADHDHPLLFVPIAPI